MPDSINLNPRNQENLGLDSHGYLLNTTKNQELERYLRLDLGENVLGCNPKVKQYFKNLESQILNRYADPSAARLATAIAEQNEIRASNVLVANSSDDLIVFLASSMLDEHRVAAVIHPTFFRYAEVSMSFGAKVQHFYTRKTENYTFTLGLINQVISEIRKKNISVLWLCNPVNPTGNLVEMKMIINLIKRTSATIILDEAFVEYCDSQFAFQTAQLIREYKNLVVLRTFSKTYGLAGVRVAYLLAHEDTVIKLKQLRSSLAMTSHLAQEIAVVAIQDQEWVETMKIEVANLREVTRKEIRQLHSYELGGDSRTNVYLLRHKRKNLYAELKQRGILVSDFSSVQGLEGMQFVRITIGTIDQNTQLIRALKEIA